MPNRSAVIALVGVFRDFHLEQESVHFGNGQGTVGADGIVAGDRRQQFISFFLGDTQ